MGDWNEEHLSAIKDGAAAFNRWRDAKLTGPNSVPYLVGADLSGLDLTGINLARAHLGQVKLRNANLGNANLSNAKVGAADLTGASLRGSNLIKTYFGSAVLDGVDLTDALYDQTTTWPAGFDPRPQQSETRSGAKAPTNPFQPNHFIVRKLPPKPADVDRFIDGVLQANGYSRGRATVDFKVDSEATNEAYLTGLLLIYEKTHRIDSGRSRMHNFSGGATGKMIAVFHVTGAVVGASTASQNAGAKKWWAFWR